MARARILKSRVTILFIAAAVMTALAVWTSVALAAGTPGTVTISSTTHPDPAVWYPSANPKFTWTAAQETGGSGTIAGYSYVLDQNPATVPPEQVTSTDDTKKYDTLAPGVWYFHIRARDGAGNWGPTRTYGMLHMNVE